MCPVAWPFRVVWGRNRSLGDADSMACVGVGGRPQDRCGSLGEHDRHQNPGHNGNRRQEPAGLIDSGAVADKPEPEREGTNVNHVSVPTPEATPARMPDGTAS